MDFPDSTTIRNNSATYEMESRSLIAKHLDSVEHSCWKELALLALLSKSLNLASSRVSFPAAAFLPSAIQSNIFLW